MTGKTSAMKWALILANLGASLSAAAGARDSGGGPPPFVPSEKFKYACQIQIESMKSSKDKRYSGTIQAQAVVQSGLGAFPGPINLDELTWNETPQPSWSEQISVSPDGEKVTLLFEETESGAHAHLEVENSQVSDSWQHELISHGISPKVPFESREPFTAQANIEERIRRFDSSEGTKLFSYYSSVSATCQRVE